MHFTMSSGGHVYKEGNSFLGLEKKLQARAKAAGKLIYSMLITYANTLHTLPKKRPQSQKEIEKKLKRRMVSARKGQAPGRVLPTTLWLFFLSLSLVISSLVIMADTVAGFMYLGKVCIFMWDNNQAVIQKPEIIPLLVH